MHDDRTPPTLALVNPNQPIEPFDLEVKIRPEKGEARARDSIQLASDAQAVGQYRRHLERLRAEKAAAQAAGQPEKVARLQEEIQALEPLAKGGRSAADTNTRAIAAHLVNAGVEAILFELTAKEGDPNDNVRKAIGVILAHLREGGPEEKAFAQHLQEHLSLGYECLYSLPEGRIWE